MELTKYGSNINQRNSINENEIRSKYEGYDSVDESQVTDLSSIHTECSSCNELLQKNNELKYALKSMSVLQSADIIKTVQFRIPKSRHYELDEALKKCTNYVSIKFHGFDNIVSIEPDVIGEAQALRQNDFDDNDTYYNG